MRATIEMKMRLVSWAFETWQYQRFQQIELSVVLLFWFIIGNLEGTSFLICSIFNITNVSGTDSVSLIMNKSGLTDSTCLGPREMVDLDEIQFLAYHNFP
jgi:hypothetical protein